jgi:hypothetical protein
MLDGRPFFVAGHPSGGVPYGTFADEMPVGLVNRVRGCDVPFRREVRPAVSATMEA